MTLEQCFSNIFSRDPDYANGYVLRLQESEMKTDVKKEKNNMKQHKECNDKYKHVRCKIILTIVVTRSE